LHVGEPGVLHELLVSISALHIASVSDLGADPRPGLVSVDGDEQHQSGVLFGRPLRRVDVRVEPARPSLMALRLRPIVANERGNSNPIAHSETVQRGDQALVLVV
jgi:hypothetical protein